MEYLKHLPTNLISSWWMDEFYHFSEKKLVLLASTKRWARNYPIQTPNFPENPTPIITC